MTVKMAVEMAVEMAVDMTVEMAVQRGEGRRWRVTRSKGLHVDCSVQLYFVGGAVTPTHIKTHN